MNQRGRDRRIHTTGDRRQHALRSHLLVDTLDRFFDNGCRSPGWLGAADIDHKMLEQFLPVRRVMYLRMELHAEIFALQVTHCRKGTVATCREWDEAFGEFRDAVAVRHPDLGETRD